MPTIKLPNAGDTLTARIKKAEVVEGASGEQVKFTTAQGDLYIGRATADRQLLRCGFGEGEGDTATVFYGDVDGTILTFFRTPNKNPALKPYWNIKRADGDEDAPVRGTKEVPMTTPSTPPLAGTDTHKARRTALEVAYKRAWLVARSVQGTDAPFESVQAGAATLFIGYQSNHLIDTFLIAEPATVTTTTHATAGAKSPAAPAKPAKPARPAPVPPPSADDEPDFEADDAAVELDDDLPFD